MRVVDRSSMVLHGALRAARSAAGRRSGVILALLLALFGGKLPFMLASKFPAGGSDLSLRTNLDDSHFRGRPVASSVALSHCFYNRLFPHNGLHSRSLKRPNRDCRKRSKTTLCPRKEGVFMSTN